MAALGFSVLMREWRRGMAFDPWHGSLYLSLSAVITLSTVDGETNLHPWIWSAQSGTLNSWRYLRRAIVSLGKKRQEPICENIILFADVCLSVIMLQFRIVCLSKPHQSITALQGSLAAAAAKDDKPGDEFPFKETSGFLNRLITAEERAFHRSPGGRGSRPPRTPFHRRSNGAAQSGLIGTAK